jgi:hypothetical protein
MYYCCNFLKSWITWIYHRILNFIWYDLPPLSIQEQQQQRPSKRKCPPPEWMSTNGTTDTNTNHPNHHDNANIEPNKHLQWCHPMMTCCLYYAIVIPISFVLHDRLVARYFPSFIPIHTTNRTTGNSSIKRTFWLGMWFLLYAVFILIWRLYYRKETPILLVERSDNKKLCANNVLGKSHEKPKRTLLQSPQYPYIVLYEYCWLCNVTLIISGLGWVWPPTTNHDRSPMIMSYIILIGIDQLLWYIDLLIYMCTGQCPIGVAKYVFTSPHENNAVHIKHRQQQHWSNRVTWTHHLWTIPLVLYGCQYKIHFASYLLSILYLILNVTLSRYLIPSHVAIPIVVPNSELRQVATSAPSTISTIKATNNGKRSSYRYELYYLNINLSYEVYKDVQHIPFLRISSPTAMKWYQYIFALIWRWQCFNTIVYLLFCYICHNNSTAHPPLHKA